MLPSLEEIQKKIKNLETDIVEHKDHIAQGELDLIKQQLGIHNKVTQEIYNAFIALRNKVNTVT